MIMRRLDILIRSGAVLPLLLIVAANVPGAEVTPAVSSPRDFYNDGTKKFQAGKLPEAEAALQTAVASQNEKIQPYALYNLGHVRFQEGVKQLKDGPNSKSSQGAAQHAGQNGNEAIQSVDEALAGTDLQQMVSAYMQGRGSRKELKAAIAAVKQAMESNGSVLSKWQRAAGDFKSANELRPADTDARANADVVNRCIAKLVDLQQMMMQMMAGMGQQRDELKGKMKKLKEKMPGDPGQQFKGGEEEDDDDDDGKKPPPEPKEGEKEGPNKNGKERNLSPEEAEQLLGMLKLDTSRKLPLGVTDTATPKDRKGRDW
jgi:tetratricopeptide (TPR) repeat protein